jgi:hypothetical protein
MKKILRILGIASRRTAGTIAVGSFLLFCWVGFYMFAWGPDDPGVPNDVHMTFLIANIVVLLFLFVWWSVAVWTLVSQRGKELVKELEITTSKKFSVVRILQVLGGSYALGVVTAIVGTVIAIITSHTDLIDESSLLWLVFGGTVAAFPFVFRHLK